MTELPAPGALTSDPNDETTQKLLFEEQRSAISEMPGGAPQTTIDILGGVAVPVRALHAIDTEGQAAADALTNLSLSGHPEGRMLIIRAADAGRLVTLQHLAGGDGEIQLIDGLDFVLNTVPFLILIRVGARWEQVLRAQTDPIPVGVMLDFAGTNAPTNWLLMYGQIVNISSFPLLFAEIGAQFGGDGLTTFGIPDWRDRFGVGKGDMGGAAAGRILTTGAGADGIDTTVLGATGGVDRHAITEAESDSHDHGGNTGFGGGHLHQYTGFNTQANIRQGPGELEADVWKGQTVRNTQSGGSHQNPISSSGGGEAHRNLPPCFVANKIIKAA